MISSIISSPADPIKPKSFEGINHYGLPIEEIKKRIIKDGFTLDIIYSKTLSDDNMDKFVKMFFNEFILQTSHWLTNNAAPRQNMTIIFSNCKYCIVGYCKKKSIKEINIELLTNEKKIQEISFAHQDIVDKANSLKVITRIISKFFSE